MRLSQRRRGTARRRVPRHPHERTGATAVGKADADKKAVAGDVSMLGALEVLAQCAAAVAHNQALQWPAAVPNMRGAPRTGNPRAAPSAPVRLRGLRFHRRTLSTSKPAASLRRRVLDRIAFEAYERCYRTFH